MATPSQALRAVIDTVEGTSPPSARSAMDRFAHFEGTAADLRIDRAFAVTLTSAPVRLPGLGMCARRAMGIELEFAYNYAGFESVERVASDIEALEAALWGIETSSAVIVGVELAEELPVSWDPAAGVLIATIPLTIEYDRG